MRNNCYFRNKISLLKIFKYVACLTDSNANNQRCKKTINWRQKSDIVDVKKCVSDIAFKKLKEIMLLKNWNLHAASLNIKANQKVHVASFLFIVQCTVSHDI